MSPATKQEIADLRAVPGELSFEARIGDEAKRIWFRTRTAAEFVPNADAALAACLMPAMRQGGTLKMSDPVSPRLLRNQREFQSIQRAWSRAWPYNYPRLQETDVQVSTRDLPRRQTSGRVAAFFSGGVDSWSTVLDNPDLTDLIFVRGVDLLAAADHQAGLADKVEERLREAAELMGQEFHVVETNVRELSDPLVPWEAYYGCAVVAVALFLAPLFDRVMIAGDSDYEVQVAIGANRLVDQHWSTEDLELVDDGGRFSRMQRVRRIGGHPVVQQTLRVCWENPGAAYNCGRCRKCMLTLTAVEAAGLRQGVATFPPELDLGLLDGMSINQPVSLQLWEDVLDAAADSGNIELEQALGKAVVRARVELGFAPDRRRRPRRPPVSGAGVAQEIADLRAAPGELSFEARIGGESKRVWFRARTEAEFVPNADAALAACLMPAMRSGGTLTMSDPVSPRLLRNQREFAAIQQAWSPGWKQGEEPLRELDLTVPVREAEPRPPTGRVAAFFSGGVDSFATVLDNPDVTDLIFVRGVDLLPHLPQHQELADEVEARMHEAAAELGLPLHVVETNVRELSDPLVRWEVYFACPLIAIALFFEPLFDRVLIAGDTDHETQLLLDHGAIWNVVRLGSTERLEIVDWGGEMDREQRQRRAIESPTARRHLRVCWENRDGAYNCGRCMKCLRSMISLEALGVREQVESFPAELVPERILESPITQLLEVIFWEDTLRTVRTAARPDLAWPIETLLERGRETLGLDPDFRVRGSGPGAVAAGHGSRLLADRETAAMLASAGAVALLVGSYDGSGNFGDIAQLEGALKMMAPLGSELLALPVIECGARARHHDAEGGPRGVGPVLYFDPEGVGAPGLVPVEPSAALLFGVIHLYGGGYLNPAWGERKLTMLGAAEALLGTAGPVQPCRIASGLQVDAAWLAALPVANRRALARFRPLGARDPASAAALACLDPTAAALDGGDDAIAVLPHPPAGAVVAGQQALTDPAEPLLINVHCSRHAWVTDNPAAVPEFEAELLAALAGCSGRPVRVQPLIAYLDPHADERHDFEALAGACAPRSIELEPPLALRTATVEAEAGGLAAAALTITCSYHAALASLLLGVPAALLADTPYYVQKAAGLEQAFALPPELRVNSGQAPAEVAAGIAAALLDPSRGPALRANIRQRAEQQRARHASAESQLLGTLAAAALAGPGERLATLLNSRSWRLTAPLRERAAVARQRLRAARAARGRR